MSRASTILLPKLLPIQWIIMDVDGVLTDGRITYDNNGVEQKSFHVRDGFALREWHGDGGQSAIVTGRISNIVAVRAAELGVTEVLQNVDNKASALLHLLNRSGCNANQVCAIGDDLPDLGMLAGAGFPVAVGDAAPEVREAAAYVTRAPGGGGAIREVVELILKARGRWPQVVRRCRGINP